MLIEEITINNLQYPFWLSQIISAPNKIYVLGNKEILREKCIAVVGSRECSKYGAKVCKDLSYNLAKRNIITVSGLAKGIDGYCHKGTICAKGRTIAVVAHGLDMIYPKENRELAKKIIEYGGAIVSEYEIGTPPLKQNFPARNRIISGLSEATVIIEAEKRSGSLITANFALEQGREVFAVPGNIYSNNSIGTNELIKQGANVLTNYKDLLNNF